MLSLQKIHILQDSRKRVVRWYRNSLALAKFSSLQQNSKLTRV